MSEPRLVLVEWVDSFGCPTNWTPIDQCQAELLVCRSVGWLIQDDEDCKVIVPHLSASKHANSTQQGCGDMTIPTAAVMSITELSKSTSVGETASASSLAYQEPV